MMTRSGTRISIGDYQPGALGRVCELHSIYYAEAWGFGRAFEAKVASEMAGFLARFDPQRDLFKLAISDGHIVGSITIDGGEAGNEAAHLRWFIVADAAQGMGVGSALIGLGLDHARAANFRCVYLWTFEGLEPARYLYQKAGFRLVHAARGAQWGQEVTEQRFELTL